MSICALNFFDQFDSFVFLPLSVLIYRLVFNYCNDIAMRFWTHRIINSFNIFYYFYESLMHSVLGILIVDDSLILRLVIFTSALVIFKHLPALTRVLNRTEPKLDFSDDITYKLDE